jgi:PAS domain S-box-containing protein
MAFVERSPRCDDTAKVPAWPVGPPANSTPAGGERERFRLLVENSRDIIYETDETGRFVYANPAVEKILGYGRQDLLGRHYLELIQEGFRPEAQRFYDGQFADHIPDTYYEFPVQARDGAEIWIGQHVQIIVAEGRVTGFQAVARDITRRRSIETELRVYQENLEGIIDARTREMRQINEALLQEQEEAQALTLALRQAQTHLQTMLRCSPDAIIFLNRDRTFQDCNPAFEALFGFRKEEILGRSTEMIHASSEHFRSFGKLVYPVILETGYWRGEWEFRRKDGAPIQIELVTFKGDVGEETEPIIISILRDISERKEIEKEKEKAVRLIREIMAALPSILIAVDRDDRVVFWNVQAEKEFGLAARAAQDNNLFALPVSWNPVIIQRIMKQCREENRSLSCEDITFCPPQGPEGCLSLSLHPVFGEEFKGQGLLLFGANISQRRLLERQLAQAQKLEAIGSLAAGIAHEINTPAQYVGDNTRFVQSSFEVLVRLLHTYSAWFEAHSDPDLSAMLTRELTELKKRDDPDYLLEEVPRALEQTLEGIDRIRTIVKSIKDFAHPGPQEKSPLDLNRAVENTVAVSRNEWKYVARLETDLDPGLPPVPAVAGEINQVILNLIVNAAQALAAKNEGLGLGSGLITVRTRQAGQWAELEVQDNGPGIPEEIRTKVFDPFFTTKEVGRGTGQGLAICHTIIVDKHQGAISFESAVDRGTTFRLRIPLED